MRVLIVITKSEQGGAALHVRDLVAGLKHQCDFAVVTGDEGFLTEQMHMLGIPVFVEPNLTRAIRPAKDLQAIRSIRRIIRQFRPQLLHAHTFKAGVAGRLAAWLEKTPSIYTPHAWPFVTGAPRHWQLIGIPVEKLLGRFGNETICVSQYENDLGHAYRVLPKGQGITIHNGLPDSPARAAPGEAVPAPCLIMVARFSAQKAQGLLLEALAGLAVPFRCAFVGDGPTRAAIEQQAATCGLQEKIQFLGTRADVDALLQESHIFVLASNWESFPLSILEAMRAGLPVVATDIGGIREAVFDGETGFLIPPGDKTVLQDRLQQLLTQPDLRSQMGAAGRKNFETRFLLAQQLHLTHEAYLKTVRDQPAQ